jgi:hypothetical protein
MSNVVEELLAHEAVTTGDPAPRADIDAVSRQLDAPLPDLLIQLWRRSDGIVLEPVDCHVPGPSEVLQALEENAWFDLSQRGLLPILDDHQSNVLAVFVRGPRAFRVAHLPHDDGSRLIYRDVESSFRALIDCANHGDSADSYFYEAQGDYPPDQPRPEDDQEAAKELIAGPHELDEWNHAVQLLDAGNIAEWRRLLETDHFVRRDARERMGKMSSASIKALLAEDQKAFESFVSQAAEAARQAGLKVGRQERDVLQVGGKWMSMEGFFHRRHIPNAVPRMIAWFEDLIAGRDPHLRTGHFMAD